MQCDKHKVFRDIERVWQERRAKDLKRHVEQSELIMGTQEKVAGDGLGEELSNPRYRTRPEDLQYLEEEEGKVSKLAQGCNKVWKESNDPDPEMEVLTYGDVSLTQDEINLLQLGPGFMVCRSLDREELQVEAGVTMSKIRWSRSSRGVEKMTDREVEKKSEQLTEEEESIAEAIESEARDVLSTDGKSLDMRKKRPTDMRNNRNVRMPAPGPPMVEAEMNTRVGAWTRAFLKFREAKCDKKGAQKETNLTVSQTLGFRTLSKKVAKLEAVVL